MISADSSCRFCSRECQVPTPDLALQSGLPERKWLSWLRCFASLSMTAHDGLSIIFTELRMTKPKNCGLRTQRRGSIYQQDAGQTRPFGKTLAFM